MVSNQSSDVRHKQRPERGGREYKKGKLEPLQEESGAVQHAEHPDRKLIRQRIRESKLKYRVRERPPWKYGEKGHDERKETASHSCPKLFRRCHLLYTDRSWFIFALFG